MQIDVYVDANGELHANVNREDGRLVAVVLDAQGQPLLDQCNRRVREALAAGATISLAAYPNDYFPAPDPVAEVDAQLAALDHVMPRGLEDLIAALVAQLAFDPAGLPQVMQDRLAAKQELRQARSEIVSQLAQLGKS